MSPRHRKLTVLCGLLGPVVLIAGCVAAAIPYSGEKGESYSVMNHFISELGFVGVSERADVFNACQTLSGLLIAVFMAGLGRHLQTRLARVAAACGVVAAVLCGALGQVPMNELPLHLKVAFAFFGGGLLAVALFNLAIALDRQARLPRWLALPGLLAFASFAAFLAYPPVTGQTPDELIKLYRTARPGIWGIAIIEWLVLVTTMAWILLVSGCLWRRGLRQPQG